MALSIAVHLLTPTLDMYGESDPSAAYSLSGHVSISVSPSFTLFDNRKTARLLLQSLSLTFEGQSETLTPDTGYSSLRLCSVTRELVPSQPIELSNEGFDEPCIWNVIFNLPIPGWLPPTTTLGIENIGIRYSLFATATLANLDDDQQSPWSFASLCSPFRSRVKVAHGQTEVHLRRFISARADDLDPKTTNYLVNSHASASTSVSGKPRIPVEVLNKIQVLASVPEYVDVKSHTLPLTLRMRTNDISEEDCKKLQVTEVVIDLLQQEKCRSRPSARYMLQYPLPPQEMQPPNIPLLDPHPISGIYDVGFFVGSGFSETVSRTFSLLPSQSCGTYKLSENNYVFANDATPQEVPTWYTMDALVPFVQCSPANADVESPEWAGSSNIRPSLSSPLHSVSHNISVSLTCAFDLPTGEIAYEQLKFNLPIAFANVAPNLPPVRTWTPLPIHSSSSANAAAAAPISTAPPSSSSPDFSSSDPIPILPAYSQLYNFHGERKIDYSTPLPLYSPRSPTGIPVDSSLTSPSSDSHLDVYHGDHDHNVKINTPLLTHGSDAVEVHV